MSTEGSGTGRTNGSTAPTIYDVAEASGYSPSTVSRALHKPGRLSEKTERAIREIAAALGYQANPFAQALPRGRTGIVGMVVSDITNPAFFEMIRMAEHEATRLGKMLVLAETQGQADLERERLAKMLPVIDGALLVTSRLADEDLLSIVEQKPIVLVNRVLDGICSVRPDDGSGLSDAFEDLHRLGHRSIAFVSGPADSWVSRHRWEQVLMEAERHAMTAVEIGPGTGTREVPDDTVRRILAAGVTAVHTYNDLVAIGLLGACKRLGIEVPGRLSIIGHDAIFGSDFTDPPLSTVKLPLAEIGLSAMRQLAGLVDGTQGEAVALRPSEYVVRGSTGPAPAK